MRTSLLRSVAAGGLVLSAACSGAAAAASVAGADISDEDVAAAAGVFTSVASLSTSACGEVATEGDTQDASCNRFTLGALIGFSVAEDNASANGIVLTDDEVAETADRFDMNFGEGALQAALDANGATYDQFVTVLRGSMLQQEVAAALVEATVSEDELRAQYDEDLASHVIVQADHILVDTREEADAVYDEVTAPGATREDFLALAVEVSKDPGVEQNGGALGSTPVSQFTPGFREAVLELEVDRISPPVQSEFGWHVIHMVQKEVTPFEDVRADLVASRAGPAFAEHERGLLGNGDIQVNPRFGRLDPQTLIVVRITSTDPLASAEPSGPVNVAPPQG